MNKRNNHYPLLLLVLYIIHRVLSIHQFFHFQPPEWVFSISVVYSGSMISRHIFGKVRRANFHRSSVVHLEKPLSIKLIIIYSILDIFEKVFVNYYYEASFQFSCWINITHKERKRKYEWKRNIYMHVYIWVVFAALFFVLLKP